MSALTYHCDIGTNNIKTVTFDPILKSGPNHTLTNKNGFFKYKKNNIF